MSAGYTCRAIGVGILMSVAAGTGWGQERFSEQIEVSEVEVPVRVVVKGKPVAGLTRDDFELYDEGELQDIIGFRIQETRQVISGPRAVRVASPSPVAAGRRLLLLFDFSHSRPQRLAHALRGIRGSLAERLGPLDRVAVATYGYISGINLLVGFTDDSSELELAFDAIDAMLAAKGKRQRELLDELHAARFGAGDSAFKALSDELGAAAALAVLSGPVVYDEAEDAGVVVEEQKSVWAPIKVRVEVDVREPMSVAQDQIGTDIDTSAIRALGLALTELTTLLRDVDGQKEMLLVSEGFSGALLENARSQFFLQKAFRAFRDSGWTLHAIDVGGIPGMDDVGFESNSLFFMTEATGGDLIENINNFSTATAEILRRISVVYFLSFQPQDRGAPGEFRRLEVRLKEPPKGAQILYRPGYYARRPPAERGVFEQRMDGVQWLTSNLEVDEMDVGVFAAVVSDPLGGIRIPVAVELAGAALADIETKRPTRVGLQLVALDGEADVRDVLSGEAKVDFADLAGTFSRGGLRFVGELVLPPGSYQLRVLVRSSRQGEIFLGTFPFTVAVGAENTLAPPAAESERRDSDWLTVETERRTAYFQ